MRPSKLALRVATEIGPYHHLAESAASLLLLSGRLAYGLWGFSLGETA